MRRNISRFRSVTSNAGIKKVIPATRRRKILKLRLLAILASLYLCFSAVSSTSSAKPASSDWPQWRGPDRSGVSSETGLLKQWPAAGPKLLWQLNDIGDGYSTPAVVGTRIYLMSNRGMDNEFVQALSTSRRKSYLDHARRQRGQSESGTKLSESAIDSDDRWKVHLRARL